MDFGLERRRHRNGLEPYDGRCSLFDARPAADGRQTGLRRGVQRAIGTAIRYEWRERGSRGPGIRRLGVHVDRTVHRGYSEGEWPINYTKRPHAFNSEEGGRQV